MEGDIRIIKGCKRRNRKSQLELFEKYSPTLKSICFRYVNNEFDADEIVQEGFIKIFNSIGKFEETGSFFSWMKRIIVNTAIDHCRKSKKLKFSEIDPEHMDYSDENMDSLIDIIKESNISQDKIINCINQLAEGHRVVFNLFVFENYSHKEIANELGVSESTSKTQLLRARKNLQKEILKLI